MTTMIAGAGGSGETPATIKLEAVSGAVEPRYFQIFTPGLEVSVLRKSSEANGTLERDWFVETVNREAGTIGIIQGGLGNTNVRTVDVKDMFKWNMGIGPQSKFVKDGREYTCMEIEGGKIRLMATPDSVSPTGKISVENRNEDMSTLIGDSSWVLLPPNLKEGEISLSRKVIVHRTARNGNPAYYEGNWNIIRIRQDKILVDLESTNLALDGKIGYRTVTIADLIKWNNAEK